MTWLMRRLVTSLALTALFAPAALAGGASARVEGPAKDRRIYTVRTYMCSNPASLKMTAWAEGMVNGKRTTLPLAIHKTREKGVFEFQRNWPADGKWSVRLALGQGRSPVTVAALGQDGAVTTQQLVWEGDGKPECDAIVCGDDGC